MIGSEVNKEAVLRFRWHYLICLLLVIATLSIYWEVKEFEFIDYDDYLYVVENPHVHGGLSLKSVAWAFRTSDAANWHPLTWFSHLLDIELYGLNPGPHHLTSLFFHIINTLLLFLTFHRMTGAVWRSGFVAALFALHPLHVESVAWIAERKDVLSTFFWMLTMLSYAWYIEHRKMSRYLLTLLLFMMGLMAKPMVVTLPFVLMLMDYWPLARFQAAIKVGVEKKVKYTHLVLEKVPLIVITVISSFITIIIQTKGGAVENYPLNIRFANAIVSYVRYIGKTIWPSHLAVFYPHPGMWPWWQVIVSFVLLGVVTFLVISSLRMQPYLAVGWLWYLGTLVPVIGLVQVGSQAMADRYTYVPLIGLFIMFAWGCYDLFEGWRYKKSGFTLFALVSLSGLMAVTWIQVGYWQNSIKLFSHAIEVTSNNLIAYNSLGAAFEREGRFEEAIRYFSKMIEINPYAADAYFNLGNVLASQGDDKGAINRYMEALKYDQRHAKAHYNLGTVFQRGGQFDQAIDHYIKALQIDPNYAEAHNNLGSIFALQGRADDAIHHFQAAIQIRPDYVGAHRNLKKIFQSKEK